MRPSRSPKLAAFAAFAGPPDLPTRAYAVARHSARRGSLLGQKHRPRPVKIRPDLFQSLDLGQIVDPDVGGIGVLDQIVLMIILRRIKALQRFYPGGDRAGENMRRVQLGNIGARSRFLFGTGGKDFGTVLGALVGTLAVHFGGIMR